MELNLRTILVVLGSLVMLGILLDGFRRMRRARQEALSLDVKGDFKFPEETFSSELPNGGSRVVGDIDAEELLEDAKNFRDQLDGLSGISALDGQDSLSEETVYSGEPDFQRETYKPETSKSETSDFDTTILDTNDLEEYTLDLATEQPESLMKNDVNNDEGFQSAQEEALTSALAKEQMPDILVPKAKPLDLDELVPLLMDVEELGEEIEPQEQKSYQNDFETEASKYDDLGAEKIELTIEDIPNIEASVADLANLLSPQVEDPALSDKLDDGRQEAADMMTQAAYAPVKKPGVNAERLADRVEASLVLVTHVVPHDENGFCGEDILYLVNSCDLRHGEKDIFHRFEKEEGEGNVQFSMANSFKPGTFDPETLLHERIYGLTLFMSLPGPAKAMDAFEAMTEMASVIARNLGGDVHDETHSIMALQTIEHNRQQVRDFVRKQKLAGKK